MRDVFVAGYHSIKDLRQDVDEWFGNPKEEQEIQDLLSILILALVKLRGDELPDRRKQRPRRRPKTNRYPQLWYPGDEVSNAKVYQV